MFSKFKRKILVLLVLIVISVFVCTIKVSAIQSLGFLGKELIICNAKEKIFDEEKYFTEEDWFLEIPKIGLKAKINYGTTKEVMNKYIGHFDNTKLWKGNVGLAAHNRGYPVNYFRKLKELQIGDEIYYTTVFGTKTYKVDIVTIISDTDWSYLKETNDNRITLITCVENEPNYRRCIQGIEI